MSPTSPFMKEISIIIRWMGWIALGFFGLIGCAHHPTPIPVDPAAVIQKNYDYSAPADINRQSKPVWILPIINQGWVPARIDPKTGDWLGGHYQATIIQDGHWATLEEAEQSGRPFIRSGEGAPIIPPLSAPGSSQGGAELDLAHLESRITELEKTEVNRTSTAAPSSLTLSAQEPGTVQTLEIGPQKKLVVRYFENDEVEINYEGKQYRRKLPHSQAKLKITVP